MISLAWLIPLFPVLGVLINGLFGARYVREKAGYVACAATGLSFLVVLGIAAEMIFGAGGSHTITLWSWITAGSFDYSSIRASGSEGYTVAAHIGSIGDDDNDSGWIGGDPGGEPVPEPATILLALLGGGAAAGARRRRLKLKAASQK